jgi:hypothetical protein
MDDKVKLILTVIAIGITVGVIVAIVFITILGAQATEVDVGPVKFKLPTEEAKSVVIATSMPSIGEDAPCAFVTVNQVGELRNIKDVAAAIEQAEQFAEYKQNDYREGDSIPANVLIATDLHSTNLEQFAVIPINNQGGWGLFVTTRELSAPNAGTYWCIR